MYDVIVGKKWSTPVDVFDDPLVLVDQIFVDVFGVFERRRRNEVGDRHFPVSRQEFFVAEEVAFEERVRLYVFVPEFWNQGSI